MNEQRVYHLCGQALWRVDDAATPAYFSSQVEGESVRLTHCPQCQAELSADSLQTTSDPAQPGVPPRTAPTSAALHREADQLVDAAEQMEGRAGTMRDRAERLRQQGDHSD